MAKYRQEKRKKRMREQRRNVLIGVLIVVIALAIILSIRLILDATQPIGEFTVVTPMPRPQAQGLSMGNPDAPVKIDVFEDYQCPACASYTHNTEDRIVVELIPTGQVYYTFHHYPFLDDRSASKESDQAANASMCANEQGRFWDFHDMLYSNQQGENLMGFSDKRLLAFAEAIGMDMTKFKSCFTENRYKAEIEKDTSDGVKLGVTGTPSVFVNGKIVKPGYIPSYDDVKAAVDAVLQSK